MDWQSVTQDAEGHFSIPKRWLKIHYYEALNILFRFENSLRVFVYAILKNEFFESWRDCNFSMPGGEQGSINSLAAKRIRQAESYGYLGFDIKAPLMHLTSGELVELITSETHWPKFRPYFRGNKEIIKNKLLEIGTIRNALAHFRPIKPDDIELVKQNSRHTLLGVEECLRNIFTQNLRVPTNTSEEWYLELSTLGADRIKTVPFYSTDELWINVRLNFSIPILSKSGEPDGFLSFVVPKINTPNILLTHPVLCKHVTYFTEHVNYPVLSQDYDIKVTKDLNFVFRKDILVRNHTAIANEFREVVRKVTEECDLLGQDQLARGSVVESAEIFSWWSQPEGQEGKWAHFYFQLTQPYQANHPDEYWGLNENTADIVAARKRYPWMPEDISEADPHRF